jgi:hypothetical protein
LPITGIMNKGMSSRVNNTRNKSEVKYKTTQGSMIPDDDSEMGVMMPYQPVRSHPTDVALAKLINERRVGINGPPL